MGQNKPFTAVLPHETNFYKIYKAGCSGKYPNYENSMLHHCCEHCQVKCSVTHVFTNYFLQCSFN